MAETICMRPDVTAGAHCWHRTGTVYLSCPPQWDEQCCHCGDVRRLTEVYSLLPDVGHGLFHREAPHG